MSKDGVRRLDRGGPPLGLFDAIPFQEETVGLEPGDWVVVFSDGVSEALSAAGEEFGDARIAEVARAHYDHEPAVLLEALLSSVRTFATGAPQSDDVTALVVRYRGPSNGGGKSGSGDDITRAIDKDGAGGAPNA
jgi:sigma-B regulation protein RsbU (phosphoserine phosphatase)